MVPNGEREMLLMSSAVMVDGPFGLAWLRPHALFGMAGVDPLVHSAFWSLTLNTVLYVLVSLMHTPPPLEQLQATLLVDVFRDHAAETARFVSRAWPGSCTSSTRPSACANTAGSSR